MSLPSDITAVSIGQCWDVRDHLLKALSPKEQSVFEKFRVKKRRRDWLAGRIAAKRAVQRKWGTPFSQISIWATEDGQPKVHIGGQPVDLCLSISHCASLALASVLEVPVGIDLEVVQARGADFEETVLTPLDRESLGLFSGVARHVALTELWCQKEAYAKWTGRGLRIPFSKLVVPHGLGVERGRLTFGGHDFCWARVSGHEVLPIDRAGSTVQLEAR